MEQNNKPKATMEDFRTLETLTRSLYTSFQVNGSSEESELTAQANQELNDFVESRDWFPTILRENGKESLLELKRQNHNIKLEDCVIGADQRRMLDIIDNYAVPRTGLIFLTPQSTVGRAPFYSSEKIIGQWHVKTLWFNMAVLLLMSIIATVLLLTDCPGRYIRKSEN